jgi:alpha-mannosidase
VRDSRLQVAGEGVVVTSLKPSDDGTSLMIRLFNAGDRATTAQLNWSDATPRQVTVSSPREETGEPVAGPLSLPPLGIVTLRATLAEEP